MSREETVLVRIKRFGAMWATCGIGLRPPEEMVGREDIKYLCPKLVPGQVVRLPITHPILKNAGKLIEVVSEIERDEFARPWVFKSPEDAIRANPTKSRATPDQIAEGLALAQGAVEKRREEHEELVRAQANAVKATKRDGKIVAPVPARDTFPDDWGYDPGAKDSDHTVVSDTDMFDGDDGEDVPNESRSQNRILRAEKEDAVPVDEPLPESKSTVKRRRRTTRTKS